jgi:ParB-like chromosome segregation protein Spo0J
MSLHLNPEYEKLLPRMSEEEFAELKASIESEGQHYPIIANENLEVLDGHHRFRACTELGIEPDFEIRQFDDKLLEKKFVIEANLRRRHLNNFQLVELAVPLLEIERTLAKKRQVQGGKNGRNLQLGITSEDAEPEVKAKATEIVAKKAGISTRTFERGKKLLEEASEEEKQKLREGKTSIGKVYREVVAPAPKPVEKSPAVIEEQAEKNMAALTAVLKSLLDSGVYCPSCGNKTFECSNCHKSLQELLNQQPKKQ